LCETPTPAPTVTTPVTYNLNDTATQLTATTAGTGLAWYTAATGGVGSVTAPTPSTATVGSTSYWVSSTNANGCESTRIEIVVTVTPLPATHLNFDGVNDYVALPTAANNIPAGNSNYTIEAWINPSELGEKHIVAWGDYEQTNKVNAFRLTPTGLVNYWWGQDYSVNFTFTPGTWYHVATTFDGTSRKIYVNGNLITTNAFLNNPNSGTHNVTNTANVTIGAGNNLTANGFFKGSMDEVRIWNVARTITQISGSRYCELQGTETGLVAYYKFNQGADAGTNTTITSLTNSVSGGATGTLTNFALTGTTSNWLAGSPVTTGSIVPSAPTVTTPVVYCQNAIPNALTATTGGTGLLWYTAATGGTGTATAPTPSTTTTGNTSYWVTSTNANGCESTRTEIVVTVNAAPTAPTVTTPVVYCQNAIPNALTATTGGTGLLWYTAATGGTGTATAPTPSTTTTGNTSYWVASTNANGCESTRTEIVVTVNAAPTAPTVTTPVTYNLNDTATALTATTGGTGLLWYTTATGGSGTATAPTPSTTTAGNTSYWVASTNANGCESARTEIVVTVNAPATHLNFDGVDDYVALPPTATNIPAGNSNYTIEAWINPSALGDRHIVAWGNYQNTNQVNAFRLSNSGLINYWWDNDLFVSYAFTLGTWYHVAATYDGTTRKIYVNGNVVGQDTPQTNVHFVTNTANVTIGAGNNLAANGFFKGSMDEVRIWNKALTAADIMNTMNCEAQAQSELVAYYKFNQGFNNANNAGVTTLTNSGSGVANGTLTNFGLTGATSNWASGSQVTTGNVCTTLGTSSFDISATLKIYPNPATSLVNIDFQDVEDAAVTVSDINGRVLFTQKLNKTSNNVNIENLASGIYLFKVSSSKGSATSKVIKN
jgi:Concanavalin A-like lectin/glucanases superfamily/Secretion system C-terminal sorting domain/Ig-like domain CHU_C associated